MLGAREMGIKKFLKKILSFSPLTLWQNKLFFYSVFFPLPKHPHCPQPRRNKDYCLILANGPSVKDILPQILRRRDQFDLYTVNFITEDNIFFQLKSTMHILADQNFFEPTASPELEKKRRRLKEAFHKVDWPLQLAIPSPYLSLAEQSYAAQHISFLGFPARSLNFGKKYQKQVIEKGYYSFGFQNVVTAALYMAIMAGYKKILLAGVDADWMKSIQVDKNNRVYILDTHFYTDKPEKNYFNVPYRYILKSLINYFSELETIDYFANANNIKIINLNPNSCVDIFPKQEITDIVL